jgi:hypothetical protein
MRRVLIWLNDAQTANNDTLRLGRVTLYVNLPGLRAAKAPKELEDFVTGRP